MRISDGRINYLSRLIAKSLAASDLVMCQSRKEDSLSPWGEGRGEGEQASSYSDPDFLDLLAKEAKKAFIFFFQKEDEIDEKVRAKIASIKRGVPEGSSEWEILYRQYYNEELDKM